MNGPRGNKELEAGTPERPEVEEMIEAGTVRFWELETLVGSARLVAEVYRAMDSRRATGTDLPDPFDDTLQRRN